MGKNVLSLIKPETVVIILHRASWLVLMGMGPLIEAFHDVSDRPECPEQHIEFVAIQIAIVAIEES